MYQQGSYNVFAANFGNQCTYWASQRYHQLTGIWVPMTGNAYQWASEAASAGWQVSSRPPTGVPSIICLQGSAGQGVESQFGHVAVVERVNTDGSVYTSDYNWSPHLGDSVMVNVTFRPGPGVSFIWASGSAGSIPVVNRVAGAVSDTALSAKKTFSLASNAAISQALASFDDALVLTNPFDVQAQTDSAAGISFTDPVSWLNGFGNNLISDFVALIWRALFISLGAFLLYRVLDHYVNFTGMAQQTAERAKGFATAIGPLMAA